MYNDDNLNPVNNTNNEQTEQGFEANAEVMSEINEVNSENMVPDNGAEMKKEAAEADKIEVVDTEIKAAEVNANEDSVYHFNKEQLENQWQPNTGTYFNDNVNKTKEKTKKAKKVKKPKKPVTGGKIFAACTATALVAVVASSGVMYGLYKNTIEEKYVLKTEYAAQNIGTTETALNTLSVSDGESEYQYTVSQVAEAVLPSVVSITSTAIVESNMNPFYGGGSYQVTGAGSGIIVGTNETELLIVTNNHVVEDTTSLTVEFINGESIDEAYIKGTDSSNDLAVVAIPIDELDEETLDSIKIATLGSSDELVVGESVIAIGNALGYGQSVTSGVVSALGREIELDTGAITVIQTDASINGGNSGGALVNRNGEVIGINVAKASSGSSSSSVEGMGYAIPVSEVMDIISDLMSKETKLPVAEDEQGYLGITSSTYVEVDSSTSEMYNIPVGIYMKDVIEGSPLDEAGVQAGDVIVAVNGTKIETYDELKNEMQYYAVGDTVTLTVEVQGSRKYKEKEMEVTLIDLETLEEMLD